MKSFLFSLGLIAASVMNLPGQGRVWFGNLTSLNAITVGPAGPNSVFAGSEFQTQLMYVIGTYNTEADFYAANPAASATATFFGTTGTAPAHGPFADGAGMFGGGVVQVGPTGIYTIQQRVWFNGGQYPTYEAAVAAGALADGSILVQINATAPPFPYSNTIFPSFSLGRFDFQVVPEPSPVTLAGLGVAALILFGLRKPASAGSSPRAGR